MGLAIVAALPLIALAVEFSRWNRFPRITAAGAVAPPHLPLDHLLVSWRATCSDGNVPSG